MATLKITLTAEVKDANSAVVGSLVTATETYTGGDFIVHQVTVAHSTSNQQLDLGELGSAGVMRLFIKSDKAITLEVHANTGVDARYIPAGGGHWWAGSAAETDFFVTNASGTDAATVTVYGIEAP